MLLHHQEKLHLPRSISASSRRSLVHGFNVSYGSEDKSPRTKDISKERLTQPHTACKAIGNTFPNSHRLSSEGEREQVSITLNFQTFSTLKVKRPETLTLLSCRAKHINHLAVLYNPSPLALLPILGYQPARKYSGGKKKIKRAPNDMTLQKAHRGRAASCAASFLVQSLASWKHIANFCFTC